MAVLSRSGYGSLVRSSQRAQVNPTNRQRVETQSVIVRSCRAAGVGSVFREDVPPEKAAGIEDFQPQDPAVRIQVQIDHAANVLWVDAYGPHSLARSDLLNEGEVRGVCFSVITHTNWTHRTSVAHAPTPHAAVSALVPMSGRGN